VHKGGVGRTKGGAGITLDEGDFELWYDTPSFAITQPGGG